MASLVNSFWELDPEIPLANIISRWTFEDNVNDVKGSNNGTPTNITYVTDGGVAKSGSFNGSTSVAVVSDADNLSFGNGGTDSPFSVSCLVKFDLLNNNGFFICKEDGSNREWGLLQQGTRIYFRIFGQGVAANLLTVQSNVDVAATGTWYHVIGTYNGDESDPVLKFYLDGVLVDDIASESGTYQYMNNTTADVSIGKFPTVTNFTHDGLLDEIIVWDNVLNSAQALTLATDQLAGTDIDP